MKDNRYELFPIVDEEGHFLGTISRGHAHDGCKILHPVVHLHVINDNGDIYLQRRPEWKDILPGNGTPHAEVMLTWANTSKTPYAER